MRHVKHDYTVIESDYLASLLANRKIIKYFSKKFSKPQKFKIELIYNIFDVTEDTHR